MLRMGNLCGTSFIDMTSVKKYLLLVFCDVVSQHWYSPIRSLQKDGRACLTYKRWSRCANGNFQASHTNVMLTKHIWLGFKGLYDLKGKKYHETEVDFILAKQKVSFPMFDRYCIQLKFAYWPYLVTSITFHPLVNFHIQNNPYNDAFGTIHSKFSNFLAMRLPCSGVKKWEKQVNLSHST